MILLTVTPSPVVPSSQRRWRKNSRYINITRLIGALLIAALLTHLPFYVGYLWIYGEPVEGGWCSTAWCMRSLGKEIEVGDPAHKNWANVAVLSTKGYIRNKRLYRFAADWALLGGGGNARC